MRCRAVLPFILIAMIVGRPAVSAKEPVKKTTTTKSQVLKLLQQLNADARKDRLQAERDLLKIGPAVLPYLPAPELAPNISVREAVRRIRIRLEREKATRSVQPSFVTLQGEKTLQDILREITRQTGNQIESSALKKSSLEQQVRVNYRRATFWTVMDDLAKKFSLSFQSDSVTGRLTLGVKTDAQKKNAFVADNSTAFRVTVISCTVKPLVGNSKKRLLRVRWKLQAEPRLRPLFLKYSGVNLKMLAEGKTLEPFNPDAKIELPLGEGGRALTLRTDFLVDAASIPRRIRFQGTVQLQTAAGNEQITFRRMKGAAGTAIRKGGVTVTLREAVFGKPTKEGLRKVGITVAVGYDAGGPAFESHRTWIFHNRVFLLKKDGQRISKKGEFQTVLQDDGSVVLAYNFAVSGGTPLTDRFVYVAPTLLINVPVRFDLKNISVSKSSTSKEGQKR
jgi:hypothetical protein